MADSRPHYEGRAMLAKLLANGIPCTYLQLNALSYAMQVGALRHRWFKGASCFSLERLLTRQVA